MMTIGLTAVVVVCAVIPALLFHANLRVYRPPPEASNRGADGTVSGGSRC